MDWAPVAEGVGVGVGVIMLTIATVQLIGRRTLQRAGCSSDPELFIGMAIIVGRHPGPFLAKKSFISQFFNSSMISQPACLPSPCPSVLRDPSGHPTV